MRPDRSLKELRKAIAAAMARLEKYEAAAAAHEAAAAEIREMAAPIRRDIESMMAHVDAAERRAHPAVNTHTDGRENPLPRRREKASVGEVTEAEFALAVSKGKAKDRLTLAAIERDLTLTDLCKQVSDEVGREIAPGAVSMARKGLRPIADDVAAAIERLIGFAASKANWPGGIKPRAK